MGGPFEGFYDGASGLRSGSPATRNRVESMNTALPPFVLLLVLLLGCEGSPVDTGRGDFPIQTEHLAYELQVTELGFETEVRHEFENRTGSDVFVVNCNGGFPIILDRLEAGTWVPRWGPAVNDCLSPPILIPAGSTFSETLRVFAGHPGSNVVPQFPDEDIDGTYRLRWLNALSSFDERARPFGTEIPEEFRVSNPFSLTVAR